MANFTTHIAVGTVVSGALATVTHAADVVAPDNLVAVTMAGVVGSILPDIDLRDSRASRMMFAGLGILFSFAVLFHFAAKFSVVELWVLWLGSLLLVRYGLHSVFHHLAVHRGTWHSALAAVFCSIATAVAYYHLFNKPAGVAWLAGGFMLIGYFSHLVLDEIYSVDILDRRLKSSFGTALKTVDWRYPNAAAAMLGATIAISLVAPPVGTFAHSMANKSLWTQLSQRILPEDKWFGVIERGLVARVTLSSSDPDQTKPNRIETGTIPAEQRQEN